ncbi:hypothetical protein ACHHYP_00686 [Achlya hypogyna]|uniref:Uncharacterized protein n=1 Tax=Achlya hypogyna TaxID=1202772 RepID=A0A1V9ZU10_ACHHY|nr:hypothetical protein ACHHYP_00686 [Achlya hypogyna]
MTERNVVAEIRASCLEPLQAAVLGEGPIVYEKATEDAFETYEHWVPSLPLDATLDEVDALWMDSAQLLLQTTKSNRSMLPCIAAPVFKLIRIVSRLDDMLWTQPPKQQSSPKWAPLLLFAISHYMVEDVPWASHDTNADACNVLEHISRHVALRSGGPAPTPEELASTYFSRILSLCGAKVDKDTWVKIGCPAPYALRHVMCQVRFPNLTADTVGRCLAFALPLLDQTTVATQRLGLAMLHHVVKEATPTDIRWHGDVVLHMLAETLKIAMGDPAFLGATLRCLSDTLRVVSVAHDVTEYNRVFPSLLRSWDLTSDVALKRVYVVELRPWVVAMGAPHSLQIVQYLPAILTVLIGCMENALLAADAIATLRLVVLHAWVRMGHHVEDVVIALLRCLVFGSIQSRQPAADTATAEPPLLAECCDVMTLLQPLSKQSIPAMVGNLGDRCTELHPICTAVCAVLAVESELK